LVSTLKNICLNCGYTLPLQAIGAETNSNLILLPNSPQAGSEMLNNMVASFTASNMVGESMKGEIKGEN
jgi:hypothetical protein